MYPPDRKYTKDFEWVRMDGAEAVVGVTARLQSVLNDLIAIDLPAVGRVLAQGDSFGFVESAKAVSELIAPVSGKVVAVNEALRADLKRLGVDPYGTWIVKLEPRNPGELDMLLSHQEIARLVERPPKPESSTRPPSPPRPQVPAPPPAPNKSPEPTPEQKRDMAIALLWSTRLRDRRLRGGDEAFGDRDYSGGGYFSWRQRDIVFTSAYPSGGGVDRRYQWRDTRWTRVTAGNRSDTTASHTDYTGTWKIEVTNGVPFLVMRDERGPLRFQLQEARDGGVMLNGRPYSLLRI